jgi:hypothetical protein
LVVVGTQGLKVREGGREGGKEGGQEEGGEHNVCGDKERKETFLFGCFLPSSRC